jgi:hypothetical protein
MSAPRIVVTALLSAALAFGATSAYAENPADVATARDLFREGVALGQRGDWEGARRAFAGSLDLKRAPITIYSLATAEESSAHLVDALEHYRAFIAEPSTPATKPYEQPARDAIAELEKRVARVILRVEPAEADARVAVDGVDVPSVALGRPRLVDPGRHEITASATGYAPATQEATLPEGGSTTITLTLEVAPAASAPAGALPPLRPSRALPITLMVSGSAAFASGLTVGLLGLKQAQSSPTRDGPQVTAAKTKGLVGDVLGGTGIAALGVGILLYAVGKPTTRAASNVAPWAAGGVGGARVQF